MCYKDTISSSMIKKKTSKKSRKPARRCRTKTRKPKYLSLSLELSSSEKAQQSSHVLCSTSATTTSTSSTNDHQQLNLFPLHPENLVDDKDNHDENMAYLFSAGDGGASTLNGLLGAATTSSSGDQHDKNQKGDELSPSASLSYAYGGEVKEAVALVRTALRNKERDSSEERYVRYSEVVERRDEEVTSSATDLRYKKQNPMVKVENQRLSLKLNYKEILNAWSDKGPLYVYSDSPQTVPDVHEDFLAHELSNGPSDRSWGSHGLLWRVPELIRNSGNVHEMKKDEEQQLQQQQPLGVGVGVRAEEWKLGQREASVQRYKEKRQNRLFSKRIRYQVRKLNAEKRPRVKGRFVKRN